MGIVGVLFVLFLSARGIAGFFTEVLWFRALGFGSVFFKILWSKVGLGLFFTLLSALMLGINLVVADRVAPALLTGGVEDQMILRYREMLGRLGRRVRLVVALAFGFLAGAPVAGQWHSWLLFNNGTRFGVKDPLFNRDVGFYVFQLPFEAFVVDWAFAVGVVCVLVTAAAHYLNGGIRIQSNGRRVTSQVKLHLSVLLAVLAILRAAGYWLGRYRLLGSTRGFVDGAGYTDVKAQLPAIQLLLMISLLAVVLLIVNVFQRGWRLPVIAVGLWGLVALVAGEIYPAFVQRFQVQPAESQREQLYIERNINATRQAMGLDNVGVSKLTGEPPTAATTDNALDAVATARLLDGSSVADAFKNLQGLLGYYGFSAGGGIDVDRYQLADKTTQVLLAVRELNAKGVPASWENTHLAYTHGYGVAAAPADVVDGDGLPIFVDPTERLGLKRPQVYVGEELDSYAVLRTGRPEVDGQDKTSTYEGTGGVRLGSSLRRAAFALRFGEYNLWGSSLINDESRIMFRRSVRERVEAVAPFLSIDSDPHAVVLDGKLLWVLDGYTKTDKYPYAQRLDTSDLPGSSGLRGENMNYVRNSVKAVVDAYDGTVSLYVIDAEDPLVLTYQKIFPGLLLAESAMPPGLKEHFRYPLDLFRLQTATWGRYRIEDVGRFYERNDAWNVAQDPATSQQRVANTTTTTRAPGVLIGTPILERQEQRVDPYYTLFPSALAKGPDEFVALRTFVPFSRGDDRRELAGYMTASSDPATYGRLRVVELDQPLPKGPFLVASETSQQFATQLSLLDVEGSKVLFGDLQLIPVGNAIAWVRPWFLLATGSSNVPKLESVTVTIGGVTERGKTIEAALRKALGSTGPTSPPTTAGSGSGSGGSGGSGSGGSGASAEQLLAQAETLRKEADAALKKNPPDVSLYVDKLNQAYEKAAEAGRIALGKDVVVATSSPPTTAKA